VCVPDDWPRQVQRSSSCPLSPPAQAAMAHLLLCQATQRVVSPTPWLLLLPLPLPQPLLGACTLARRLLSLQQLLQVPTRAKFADQG